MNKPESPPPLDEGNASMSPMKRALLAIESLQARVAAAEAAANAPIAVIGLGCRVPGADDPDEFWRLLSSGSDAVGPVPSGRADLAELCSDLDRTPDAGFLQAVDGFDAAFFGIAPREANGMDPQQRLMLEVAWEALENAGVAPDRLERSATGVYLGLCSSDYAFLITKAADKALLDAHYASGIAHSVASGRLSYLLGLQGPSLTVDTACSSSLVSVHLACQALRTGECRMALAGGVNLMLSADLFVAFTQSRMLAADGRCKTFDASADGFARGEGCGVVVLKKLDEAIADGDRVLAVIRGSAVNQDGPSSSLTAPNGPAQEAVIRAALQRAGIRPEEVGYVEAHGTGTQLGDPLEMRALGEVFRHRRGAPPLVVGSVKTNVGHLEAAAGITGLIKVVLSLQHARIAPHLHFREPSPHIAWDDLPIRIPTKLDTWEPIGGRRIAGVSSFGYSGTNAHLVVEQAPDLARRGPGPTDAARRAHLYLLSARDETALRALAAKHAEFIAASDVSLQDLCATSQVGRARFSERATLISTSVAELVGQLRALSEGRAAEGVEHHRLARRDPPKVAFLFTGQGGQYAGMGRGLYASVPVFRAAIDRCAALLDGHLAKPLIELLFDEEVGRRYLDETEFTQPALFAFEYALSEWLRALGVSPIAVIGHSIGEFAAACCAGAMSLEDGIRLVALRGRLMQRLPAGGAMAAVAAPSEDVGTVIAPFAAQVAIAGINGPLQTVISGSRDRVEALCEEFEQRGLRCARLAVSHAFHSPLMDPMLAELERGVAGVRFEPPRIRFVSTVTGAPAGVAELGQPGYWTRQARQAVLFADALRSLEVLKPDLCIEVGPHPTLSPLMRVTLGEAAPPSLAASRKGVDDWSQMQRLLARLFLEGVDVDWHAVQAGAQIRRVPLPTYRFQRERHWLSGLRRAPIPNTGSDRATDPARGARPRGTANDRSHESRLTPDSPTFLREHKVHSRVVVPATLYLDMLQAAAVEYFGPGAEIEITDVVVVHAMLLEELPGAGRLVRAAVGAQNGGRLAVAITSRDDEEGLDPRADDGWTHHVSANLCRMTGVPSDSDRIRPSLRDARALCSESVAHEVFYEDFAARGLQFGPAFRSVKSLWRAGNGAGSRALGSVALAEELVAPQGGHRIHPVLLDGCLQVLAAAVRTDSADDLFLPFSIGRYRLLGAPGRQCWAYAVAHGQTSAETRSADVYVFDETGAMIAELIEVGLKRVQRATVLDLAVADGLVQQYLYAPVWMPAKPAPPNRSPDALRDAMDIPALADAASAALPRLSGSANLSRYDLGMPRLERLCQEYVVEALAELGWNRAPGSVVDPQRLFSELGIAPIHGQLFPHLLKWLERGGFLVRQPEGRLIAAAIAPVDTAATFSRLRRDHPETAAELELTSRTGRKLASALRGECDPLQLLFPGGSTEFAERVYRDSPPAKVFNGMMGAIVGEALKRKTPIRILEIGAGTGGTTAHVLPHLLQASGGVPVQYMFTDVGPLFVTRARERFGSNPFMRFGVLDLERDPGVQGFGSGSFDLILASNVIHATRDLHASLARVRSLLRPGGCLAMLEATAPQAWFDLTVGLTDGWWCFEDRTLRPDYATLPRERWLELLAECGLEAARAIGGAPGDEGVVAINTLLLARSPVGASRSPEPPRHWLLWADRAGGAAMIADGLRARGDTCTLVVADSVEALVQGDAMSIDPEAPASARQVFDRLDSAGTPVDEVVHLGSLGAAPQESVTESDLPAAYRSGVLSAMNLAKAMLQRPAPPRLWIVTQGVHQTGADQRLQPVQAPIWGLGRSLALEHPELRTVCVDLECAGAGKLASAGRPLSPEVADCLIEELRQPDAESSVALRPDGRKVLRLRRFEDRPAGLPDRPAAPWRLAPARRGSLDGFVFRLSPREAAPAGMVEISVEATGLNFKDVMNVLDMYPGDPGPLGGECAGRVVAVGDGVEHLSVGDDVLALASGSFSSHVVTPAAFVQRRPPGMSAEEGASIAIAYLTAEYCLNHLAGLRSGERVLIHAAAGGVGLAAVKLALDAGAVVFATAGSADKRRMLQEMGVACVMDSRSTTFADEVLRITEGAGVEVVLNSLSDGAIDASFRALATAGRFIEIGKRGIKTQEWVDRQRRAYVYHVVDWGETAQREPGLIQEMLSRLMARIREGTLAPLPRHVFSIDEASRAFRFMAQARHIGRIVVTHRAGQPSNPNIVRRQGTYLVTGGLSGLGLEVAQWLADRGAGRIVLLGRRKPSEKAGAMIGELRRKGSTVVAESLDVCDREALQRLLGRLRRDGPPLRGIVHAAGVLADAGLMVQDEERFSRVLSPKVKGGLLLDRLTRADAIDWFVMFSSVASVLGSAGQSNHSAANSFLDALAHERRSRGLHGLSINWGPWSQTGAAADLGIDVRGEGSGLNAVTTSQGLGALQHLLECDATQAGVVIADWVRFVRQRAGGVVPPLLSGLACDAGARPRAGSSAATRGRGAPDQTPGLPAPSEASAATELRDRLRGATEGRKRLIMSAFVREQALTTLGIDSGRSVDSRVPLAELGLDSLLAVELRNKLGFALGKPLPATLLFDYPTIESLAEHLLSAVMAEAQATGAVADQPKAASLVGSIEDLTEEEVERKLAARARRTAG